MRKNEKVVQASEEHVIDLPVKKITKMQKMKKMVSRRNGIFVLIVILAIGFVYYFAQYQKLSKDPNALAKEKTAQVIKKISELAVVPTDPNAVLASVSDITKLKGQTFFDNAQNGDQIVIFPSAMRAVLYRPSVDKIINIGPLASSPTSSTDGLANTQTAGTTSPTKTTAKVTAQPKPAPATTTVKK